MATSPKLVGTLLTTNQANAEATVNTFLKLLEAFTPQPAVEDVTNTPPGSPNEGDVYMVSATATGAWTGEEGNFAVYLDSAWFFVIPKEGMTRYVKDTNAHDKYDGSTWSSV
jgi:hypothetical protein